MPMQKSVPAKPTYNFLSTPFDPELPFLTQSGHPARILCDDRKSLDNKPLVVLIDMGETETSILLGEDGKVSTSHSDPFDLVNIEYIK